MKCYIDISDNAELLELINETLLDFEQDNYSTVSEMIRGLENILQERKMTVMNVAELYIYLAERQKDPTIYEREYASAKSMFGEEIAARVINDIKNEHKKMYAFISEHFDLVGGPDGEAPYLITFKC